MTSMIIAPSSGTAWQSNTVLWQHKTFCGLALPLSAPSEGLWSRQAGETSIIMGATSAAGAGEVSRLPAGSILRLLLLHIFTTALQSGNTGVEIGPDAGFVAMSLGLRVTPKQSAELGEQLEYLIAAKLRIAEERKAPLSVLDARRSGNRDASSGWQPVLHLNKRFFSSLQQGAVALDRDVVIALAGSAMALDAYAWLAARVPEVSAGRPVLVTWAELQQRFGQDEPQNTAAFRTAFSKSLKAVRAACPEIRFTVSQDGVELQGAAALSAALTSEPAPPMSVALEQNTTLAEIATETVTAPTLGREALNRETVPVTKPATLASAEVVEAAVPRPEPQSSLVQASAPGMTHDAKPVPERERGLDRIRLAPVLTGLEQSVWLRRGGDQANTTIEVTPGGEYNPARRSLLILEPMVLQVVGLLQPRELERIAAWAAVNAELIQDYWEGSIVSASEVAGRVKLVTPSRW